MKKKTIFAVSWTLVAALPAAQAQIPVSEKIHHSPVCKPASELVIVRGNEISALLGKPVRKLGLYRYAQSTLSPVSFQIDQKDPQGRYVIEASGPIRTPSPEPVFDENDELVFRVPDLGERLPEPSTRAQRDSLVEIEVAVPGNPRPGWLYARISSRQKPPPEPIQVRYLPDADRVHTALYQIGFSKQAPFLIDALHWRTRENRDWGADVTDTMKIRHHGKLFGFLPFRRTHADYSSRLVGVKKGPLRVIRRTSNRIRVLWKLKTPALYVDYIMMPNGFIMDTVIDIPFNIGMFFSDVETLTTIDWSDAPELPPLTIGPVQPAEQVPVNGRMSPDKHAFNNSEIPRLSVTSTFGTLTARLDIPDDFPIRPWLYLRDAIDEPDPPENRPGQFGNVGFRTTEWERIDTEIHHLKFTVCMAGLSEPRLSTTKGTKEKP